MISSMGFFQPKGRGCSSASNRQPLDPQDPDHPEVAARSPEIPRPLPADIELMGQLGRAVAR